MKMAVGSSYFGQVEVLDHFICPITHDIMTDPVMTLDGQTYERSAIERWFAQGKSTSPITGASLPGTTLIPNFAIKQGIAAYHQKLQRSSDASALTPSASAASEKKDRGPEYARIVLDYAEVTGVSQAIIQEVFERQFPALLECSSIENLTQKVGDLSVLWRAVEQKTQDIRAREDLCRQQAQLEQAVAMQRSQAAQYAQKKLREERRLRQQQLDLQQQRQQLERDRQALERRSRQQQQALANAQCQLNQAGLFSSSAGSESRPSSVSRQSSGGY